MLAAERLSPKPKRLPSAGGPTSPDDLAEAVVVVGFVGREAAAVVVVLPLFSSLVASTGARLVGRANAEFGLPTVSRFLGWTGLEDGGCGLDVSPVVGLFFAGALLEGRTPGRMVDGAAAERPVRLDGRAGLAGALETGAFRDAAGRAAAVGARRTFVVAGKTTLPSNSSS